MSSLEGSDMDQDCVSCLQGYCPAAFVIVLFVVTCLLLSQLIGLLWANLMHSLNFWMYLVEVDMTTKFGANPKVMSMGRWSCLPYMRMYGLKLVAEFWVQL